MRRWLKRLIILNTVRSGISKHTPLNVYLMNLEVKIITGMLIIWKSVVKSLNKAQETIDFEYKKMDPLTIGELDSYLKANFCYTYGDEF